jgi:hypothetical protein
VLFLSGVHPETPSSAVPRHAGAMMDIARGRPQRQRRRRHVPADPDLSQSAAAEPGQRSRREPVGLRTPRQAVPASAARRSR